MSYGAMLQRALTITWRHRALWLLGALTCVVGTLGILPSQFRSSLLVALPALELPTDRLVVRLGDGPLSGAALLGLGLLALWVVAATIASFVGQIALVGMVDEVERIGTTSIAGGLRLGWGRLLPVLGLALLIGLPVVVLLAVVLGVASLPIVMQSGRQADVAVACCCLWPLAAVLTIALAGAADLLSEFAIRCCVLDGYGVLKSLAEGCRQVRRNLGRALLTWLLLTGIGTGAGILLVVLSVGGLLTVALGEQLAWGASQSNTAAMAVGVPLYLLYAAAAAALQGLWLAFQSAAWTLAYRRMVGAPGIAVP